MRRNPPLSVRRGFARGFTPGFTPGFTLVELLLVITIIAIVLALVLVGFSQGQERARAVACLSNQRQIALANQSYAADNNGRLVSPRTSQNSNCWVNNGVPGGLVSTLDERRIETRDALKAGALWSYLGENEEAYISPQDPTAGRRPGDRVRSYSLSGFVGVGDVSYAQRADDWYSFPDPADPLSPERFRDTRFRTVTLAQIPQPARTLLTITEHDRRDDPSTSLKEDFNFQGFVVQVSPPEGLRGVWIDSPALWNRGRISISYVDGSVDAPNVIYERLEEIFLNDNDGHDVTEPSEDGNPPPAHWFLSGILLPGIIRQDIQ